MTLIRTVPESGQYRAGALSFSYVDLRAVATAQPIPPPARSAPLPKRPVPPSQGHQLVQIGFLLNGHFQPARNARDVLAKVFVELANRDAPFLERFATLPKHGRTRRYLAPTPNHLYPERPDLARDFSQEIKPGWWLGINLSRARINRIIEMACEVAGLRYGVDLKVNVGE